MMSMTKRQGDLLAFIKSYMATRDGVAPTYEEMMVELGLGSKSGIHRMILGLEERGVIRRLPGKRQRSIEVVGLSTKEALAKDIAERFYARGFYAVRIGVPLERMCLDADAFAEELKACIP